MMGGSQLQIPLVDLSHPNRAQVGEHLLGAAVDYGFVYIKSSGIDFTADTIDDLFGVVGQMTSSKNARLIVQRSQEISFCHQKKRRLHVP